MKQLIVIIIAFVFCGQVYGQQDTARNIGRYLDISLTVIDSVNPYDYDHGLMVQIFVFSEDDGKVFYDFSSDNGAAGMNLDPGTYKIVFSTLGYKSKMLLVEVANQKPPILPWYHIRMGIDLVPGKDEREIKPTGKIFYNAKEDGYQFVKY